MTFITYREHKFSSKVLAIIDKANEIVSDYQSQGYSLTLRQLYYQFISQNVFPNTKQSYDRLGETLSNARLAGLVSWDAIQDKTRNLQSMNHWDDAVGFLEDIQRYFNIDMWEDQPNYVEVWIEKDALIGVIERPCRKYDVPYIACRGYMSQSEEWAAANRFEEAINRGQEPVLIYLGDHDPSGVDMSRDHAARMEMFLGTFGMSVDVRRIALNIDQVHQYNPPPNPTKITDSRSDGYIAEFGKTCWELDALQPSVIDGLVTSSITEYIDQGLWDARRQFYKDEEAKVRKAIESLRE